MEGETPMTPAPPIPEEVREEITKWLKGSMDGFMMLVAFGGAPATAKYIKELSESCITTEAQL